jgi:hypothetical protein
MHSNKEAGAASRITNGGETNLEECVPLSVRAARNARKMRGDLWPYVWMNFASILILAAALAILSYRLGVQSCH